MRFPSSRSIACSALVALVLAIAAPAFAQQAGPGVLPGNRPFTAGGAFTSPLLGPNGLPTAPTYSFASNTGLGIYRIANNNGGLVGMWDVRLQGVGTGAALNVGNVTNGIYGWFGLSGSNAILTGAGGSGLDIGANGVATWRVPTNGNLVAVTDGAPDIGTSGAKPDDILIAGGIGIGGVAESDGVYRTAATGSFEWLNRGVIQATDDGVIQLSNYNVNGFTRLILGTNTSSGVAIKKSATSILFRLGDDSGYSPYVEAGTFSAASSFYYFGSQAATHPALKRVSTEVQVRLADDSDYGNFGAYRMTAIGGGIGLSSVGNSDAGTILGTERSDPSAPAANQGVIYFKDSGGGKTQACARFNSGAVQCFATEP